MATLLDATTLGCSLFQLTRSIMMMLSLSLGISGRLGQAVRSCNNQGTKQEEWLVVSAGS